jgi:hypothetical protein
MRASDFWTGICIGAIGAYYLDSDAGRGRRIKAQAKLSKLTRGSLWTLSSASHDINHRLLGFWHKLNNQPDYGPVIDEVLVSRVRSRIGRVVSHPHSIKVSAHEGVIALSGPIVANEVLPLIICASRAHGVKKVENFLEVYKDAGNIPALQGGSRLQTRKVSRYHSTPRLVGDGVVFGLLSFMFFGLARGRLGVSTAAAASLWGFVKGLPHPEHYSRSLKRKQTSAKSPTSLLHDLTFVRMFSHH